MAISIRPVQSIGEVDGPRILAILKEVLSDLEDQLNTRGQVYVNSTGKIPDGLQRDDVLISLYRGIISLYVKDGRGTTALTASMLGGMSKQGTNFVGLKSGTIVPIATPTSDFPNANDWGFYFKTTATQRLYLMYNVNGVMFKVELT